MLRGGAKNKAFGTRKERKMKSQLIDADDKIVIQCPNCTSQELVYLIRYNGRIKDELIGSECESCRTKYVIHVITNLSCKISVYGCGDSSVETIDGDSEDFQS